jgi:transposase-like protein
MREKLEGLVTLSKLMNVKLDERRENKGRIIEGNWILGMIDLNGGVRLEICPDNSRSKETLLDLINKTVEKGTTIMTDCWKGYSGLTGDGFIHLIISHKYHFIDPDTWVNTQKIESNWRPFKRKLTRGGIKKNALANHMCEYLWRKDQKENSQGLFLALITDIKTQFPLK